MDIATDVDAPEDNVLCTLHFEKALRDVLSWLRLEQDTFNRYLYNHPAVHLPVVTAFQNIIHLIPLPTPAATPSPNIAEETLHHEPLESIRETGPGGSSVPKDLPVDEDGDDLDTLHQRCGRVYTPETAHQGDPSSAGNDPGLTTISALASPKPVDDHVVIHQATAEVGVGAGVERVNHDGSQATSTERSLEAGDAQNVHDLRDIVSPASSNSDVFPPTPRIRPKTLPRKRKVSSTKSSASKRQRKSKDNSDPDLLLLNTMARIQDIATFDDIIFLWERLQLLSTSTTNSGQKTTYPSHDALSPRRRRLERLWLCIGDSTKEERWATIVRRACQAEFFAQYLEERARFNLWKGRRKGINRHRSTPSESEDDISPLSHPLTEYVDLCFPKDVFDNREKAKKRFENMVQTQEPWVKFNQRFGKGVFVVTPTVFRDEHLRILGKSQLDNLLNLIDTSFPYLKDHLNSLSELLSFFIEHNRLPPNKLRLELLSKDQLLSMRSKAWSLQELLEPCELRGEAHPANDLPEHGPLTRHSSSSRENDLFVSRDPSPDMNFDVCSISPFLASPSIYLSESTPSFHEVSCASTALPEPPLLTGERDLETEFTFDVRDQEKPLIPNTDDRGNLSRLDNLFLVSPLVLRP